MADLFEDKAKDWDARPVPAQISAGVGAALETRVALGPELRVMDFGAGTGLVSAHLAPHVKVIYAVDISEAMLAQLAAKPALQGKVEVHCQDILTTPLGKPIDLVVSAMAMHHVEDTAALARAFAAHLAPGGRIALADLDAEDGSFHAAGTEGVYHHGFSRDALRGQLADAGFRDIAFDTATTVVKEGRRYAVFLVTATKA